MVVIYLGLCVAMGCLQNRLIFPGASSQGSELAEVPESALYERIKLTTRDGDTTYAIFGVAADRFQQPLPDAATRPTLIYFYGNGDRLSNAIGMLNYFRRLGANVLAVEYVGYGMASGKPSEKAVYATADAAYDHLLSRTDIDHARIVPTGMSLGCAAAIDLASRRPTAGVICFSPFTSMLAMGREVMPLLPTSLLLTSRFDNQAKLAGYPNPVFITHGRNDSVIPFWMGERLSKIPAGPVTFVPVIDADHNDVPEAGGDELESALRDWIGRR